MHVAAGDFDPRNHQGDKGLSILSVLAADNCDSWQGAGGEWGVDIC